MNSIEDFVWDSCYHAAVLTVIKKACEDIMKNGLVSPDEAIGIVDSVMKATVFNEDWRKQLEKWEKAVGSPILN